MKPSLAGALCALSSFATYACHDVLIKLLGAHYSSIQIVFFSALLGFPMVTVLLLGDRTDRSLRPRHPFWVLLRALCFVTNAVLCFYAFSVLPMAQTYAFLFATPLLVTILSVPLLGERVGLHRGLAVLAGMIGVLIVLRPGAAELATGHIAALSAACCGAMSSVIIRKIGRDERPIVLMMSPMLANVALLGVALPWVYRPMPIEHLGMLAAVAFGAMIGGLLLIAAYRRAEAVIVAPMQYSQMIWAVIFGYFIFAEKIDRYTLIGSLVIIGSGIYIVLRETRQSKRRSRTPLRFARTGLAAGDAADPDMALGTMARAAAPAQTRNVKDMG